MIRKWLRVPRGKIAQFLSVAQANNIAEIEERDDLINTCIIMNEEITDGTQIDWRALWQAVKVDPDVQALPLDIRRALFKIVVVIAKRLDLED